MKVRKQLKANERTKERKRRKQMIVKIISYVAVIYFRTNWTVKITLFSVDLVHPLLSLSSPTKSLAKFSSDFASGISVWIAFFLIVQICIVLFSHISTPLFLYLSGHTLFGSINCVINLFKIVRSSFYTSRPSSVVLISDWTIYWMVKWSRIKEHVFPHIFCRREFVSLE